MREWIAEPTLPRGWEKEQVPRRSGPLVIVPNCKKSGGLVGLVGDLSFPVMPSPPSQRKAAAYEGARCKGLEIAREGEERH
jgi:hypothetical protein